MSILLQSINDAIQSAARWVIKTLEAILNWVFALTNNAAHFRDMIRWGVFFFAWAWVIIDLRSNQQWFEFLTISFRAFANPLRENALLDMTRMFAEDANQPWAIWALFLRFIFETILHPEVVRHLIALLAPFFLIHRLAGIYLADIFEKDETVGRRFVLQTAFGEGYNTIRIREGKVAADYEDSTIIQIGGPGYVQVELDSAVIFEKPDGTLNIIGPTSGGGQTSNAQGISVWRSSAIISGFERIRQCVDLRDHSGVVSVTNRSRDGIKVSVEDVQFSYSVARGGQLASLQTPYPFDRQAIEKMVYKVIRSVKVGAPPSTNPDWKTSLPGPKGGPIIGKINVFTGTRGVSEFLTGIGEPEEMALLDREQKLTDQGRELSGMESTSLVVSPIKGSPFTPREELTRLFYADSANLLNTHGIQLNWIGVGTWKTPIESITANHLEAWKLSRENYSRSNSIVLEQVRNDTRLQHQMRMIEALPIRKFFDLKDKDDETVVDQLLNEYLQKLQDAMELHERDGEPVPATILTAIRALQNLLNYRAHNIGEEDLPEPGEPEPQAQPAPPEPRPEPDEFELSQQLLHLAGGDQARARELVLAEQSLNPGLPRRTLLLNAIQRLRGITP